MSKRKTYIDGWKMYPWCCLGHHVQGAAVIGCILYGSVPVMVAGAVWMALYVSYQGLSMVRKKDSAGLDVSDFMAGIILGSILMLAVSTARACEALHTVMAPKLTQMYTECRMQVNSTASIGNDRWEYIMTATCPMDEGRKRVVYLDCDRKQVSEKNCTQRCEVRSWDWGFD